MCLRTKQRLPKIAWKPITTYKIIYSRDSLLFTLFRGFPIQIGNTYEETLRNIFKSRRWLFCSHYSMNKRLHSFTSKYFATTVAQNNKCNRIVVECVIPRFSFYWIGNNYDIVSNKLKYIKTLQSWK